MLTCNISRTPIYQNIRYTAVAYLSITTFAAESARHKGGIGA